MLLLLCWTLRILKSKPFFFSFDVCILAALSFFPSIWSEKISLSQSCSDSKGPARGWRFALPDVIFEALGGGHFSSTTVTQDATGPNTFLPESISTHYIRHIKQPALRPAQLWQGGEKILLFCTKGNCDTPVSASAPNPAALQPWTLSQKIFKWINKFLSTFD